MKNKEIGCETPPTYRLAKGIMLLLPLKHYTFWDGDLCVACKKKPKKKLRKKLKELGWWGENEDKNNWYFNLMPDEEVRL